MASLVGRSGRYALIPAELRLHASREALPGFADGAISRPRLVHALLTHWWRHRPPWDPSSVRGTHRIAPRHRYVRAVARLAASPPGADRFAISRRLVSGLLDPPAPGPGAWVEKSPDNCASAGFLQRLFPGLRLIHVIRDGRDVACSFMRVPWAPDDFQSALALWERRLLRAHRGTLHLPEAQVHRMLLEDLVARDRERSYASLLEFLELPDAPAQRSFFDRELTAPRAGIGRWRSDLDSAEQARAQSLYLDALERLDVAGVHPLPPADQPATELSPAVTDRPVSTIDPWAATTGKGRGRPVPSF